MGGNSTDGGLARYQDTTFVQVYDTSNSGLPDNTVNFVTGDPNGNIWVGTYFGGVAMFDGINWTIYNTANSGLPNNTVMTIDFGLDSSVWIGTLLGGLARFQPPNRWEVYNLSNSSLPQNTVYEIAKKDSTIWLATIGGLVTFKDLGLPVLSGAILTETGVPIPGVRVTLSGDDFQTYITDATGRYSFKVAGGGSYSITPSKSNAVVESNGISSADVLLMQRHILTIAALGSPYKIIAAAEANADGDVMITTSDVVFTRLLILGSLQSYPNYRLWQFVSSDYVFPDPTYPFPFVKTRTYTNITSNQTNQDFIGIKLGDVNDSWDPNIP
jgi:hypothetical protein